ncbi:MAG TPA: ATP-grasp domain-containing protein [Capsulimonadaceae bacterium]|nr:ATP-grasp domain-containing protein [Capsulimonadaceae bacterium]
MPILVLSPRFTPYSITLARAAHASGWQVERLHRWEPTKELQKSAAVIYGEPLFAAAIAEALSVVLLEPPFDWLTRLSQDWTKREVSMSTLEKARRLSGPAFIKPAEDKSFPARVYKRGLEASDLLPKDLPVLTSEPVTWRSEFRCFVMEGKVVAISLYSRYGELAQAEDGSWPAAPHELEQARAFASYMLEENHHEIPPAVVIDVGIIEGRDWAVVEANPAFSAGIYGCDPEVVLNVVQRSCVRHSDLSSADTRWVITRSE